MKSNFSRLIFLAAFLTALFTLSAVAFADDSSSDSVPMVYWLDIANGNTARHMGNGVVEISYRYYEPGQTIASAIEKCLCNLNSEIVFPISGGTWPGYYFRGDYLPITKDGKHGLIDRFGNWAVDVIYDTEGEAWAQLGIDEAALPWSPFLRTEGLKYFDRYPGLWDVSGYYRLNDFYYDKNEGLKTEQAFVLACEFDEAMDFTDSDYACVKKDGRIGLLKNPLKKEVVNEWFAVELAAAFDCGLIPPRCAGYYTFEITRSQAAALSVRYAELVGGQALPLPDGHPFTDTSDEAIEKAYAAGFVQGTAKGAFEPDKVATREEVAVMLYRAMQKTDPDGGKNVSAPESFADFDSASDWAKPALAALVDKKVMNGVSETNLGSRYFCSTEEAIALVYRLFRRGQAK